MLLALTPHSPPLSLPTTRKTDDTNCSTPHIHLLQLLSQCTNSSQLKQIHAQTLRTTSTQNPQTLFLYSRILHFAAIYDIDYACKIFHQIPCPNSFAWNTLIKAYADNKSKQKEQAMILLHRMLEQGSVLPDKHTFPFVLKACAYLFAFCEGKQVHGLVFKHGLQSDVYVNNSLIHFYASCGNLELSRKVFDKMPERTLVSWNVMVDALVRSGELENVIGFFRGMLGLFEPDGYTMQSILSACGGSGSLSLGMWVHAYILKKFDAHLVDDVLVNASLVDMYCKCGALDLAKQVFEGMVDRNVNSWNFMILGFAMHGRVETALEYFSKMVVEEKLAPNSITFVGVLSACNHGGMLDKGRRYFHMMVNEYGIEPQLEHYGCLVDLFARAGLIDEALSVVASMPMQPDAVIWRSLLVACWKKNAGVELSEEVAMQILESGGGSSSGVYVLLSKVYASASRWNDVGLIRKLMIDLGVTKHPGCSLTEVDGTSHEFFSGDTSHPQAKEIYKVLSMIEEKLDEAGYVPDDSQATMVDDELSNEKGNSLRLHSERLAIAFGLLNNRPGTPIRIFKNLRVCNDCHRVMKLISRIFNVEIIVRDRTRFHHFKDGFCSCRDYW